MVSATLPAFHGVEKRTAWAVWTSMLPLKGIFARLSCLQSQASRDDLEKIEKYILLYQVRTSALNFANEARKHSQCIFSQ